MRLARNSRRLAVNSRKRSLQFIEIRDDYATATGATQFRTTKEPSKTLGSFSFGLSEIISSRTAAPDGLL